MLLDEVMAEAYSAPHPAKDLSFNSPPRASMSSTLLSPGRIGAEDGLFPRPSTGGRSQAVRGANKHAGS
jgi:hypothetical protein